MTHSFLHDIVTIETSPFREGRVLAALDAACAAMGLEVTRDAAGNRLVAVGPDTAAPPLVFSAHTDHPGFEVVDTDGREATLRVLGNIQSRILCEGAALVVHGKGVRGAVVQPPPPSGEALMLASFEADVSAGDAGGLDLAPLRVRGDRIEGRALDDLAGCAAMLDALAALSAEPPPWRALFLFTRAEEVGFVGASEAIRLGTLPAGACVVSVETSRAINGVSIGSGVVVRAGDRAGIFDSALTNHLAACGADLGGRDNSFSFQVGHLTGGTCEATAFACGGFRTTGLAFPLGNYHNAGRKRAREERVSLHDYRCLLRLIVEVCRTWAEERPWPDAATRGRIRSRNASFRERLYAPM
jgi:endoglucanase